MKHVCDKCGQELVDEKNLLCNDCRRSILEDIFRSETCCGMDVIRKLI